jgi:putative endonuclease
VPTWQSIQQGKKSMNDKQYYLYIMTNYETTTLYTGVTNDLIRRLYEHKNKIIEGFTSRYNVNKLVYYEIYDDIEQAIIREKQIKKWSRERKNNLIKSFNSSWNDLSESWTNCHFAPSR